MNEIQRELVDLLLTQLTKLSNSQAEDNIQLFHLIILQFNNYTNLKHKLELIQRVINILEQTKGYMREKSIKMIEILVPRQKHTYVLQKLVDMVTGTDELCKTSFIDIYLKLNLQNEILRRLRIKMLGYLEEGAQKKVSITELHKPLKRDELKRSKPCSSTYIHISL